MASAATSAMLVPPVAEADVRQPRAGVEPVVALEVRHVDAPGLAEYRSRLGPAPQRREAVHQMGAIGLEDLGGDDIAGGGNTHT